jgi:hypothetical protein
VRCPESLEPESEEAFRKGRQTTDTGQDPQQGLSKEAVKAAT